MKQQCHLSMIYLSWMVYAGGLVAAGWLGAWTFAVTWLIAGPVFQWLYIRNFPKFSAVMGYGRIVDQPAEAAQAAPANVILYTALGCPFCPVMEQRLDELKSRLGFSLTKIDVTLRPDLLASKNIRSVPAIEIGDRLFTGVITSRELAEALRPSQNAIAS